MFSDYLISEAIGSHSLPAVGAVHLMGGDLTYRLEDGPSVFELSGIGLGTRHVVLAVGTYAAERARVTKLADVADLKSAAPFVGRGGSNPSPGTIGIDDSRIAPDGAGHDTGRLITF